MSKNYVGLQFNTSFSPSDLNCLLNCVKKEYHFYVLSIGNTRKHNVIIMLHHTYPGVAIFHSV